MSSTEKGIIFNMKDVLYVLVIVGGILSSYFVNRGNINNRVSVLETKMDDVKDAVVDLEGEIRDLRSAIFVARTIQPED